MNRSLIKSISDPNLIGQFEYDWSLFMICNAILRYTECTGGVRPPLVFTPSLTVVFLDGGRIYET